MFSPDFKEFVQLLNSFQVRYLVIGGYAVAYYGHPRYTNDLDIWLDVSKANARRMVAVLNEFGFASLRLTEDDFTKPNQIIQLGHPPLRIDLLVGLARLSFRKCFASRIVAHFDDVPVNVIDITNLIASKRSTGRTQDLADVEQLERLPKRDD